MVGHLAHTNTDTEALSKFSYSAKQTRGFSIQTESMNENAFIITKYTYTCIHKHTQFVSACMQGTGTTNFYNDQEDKIISHSHWNIRWGRDTGGG